MLKFLGKNEYQGFFLKEEFGLAGNISVLTGTNGCGKTRFLNSVAAGNIQVSHGDEVVAPHWIKLIGHLQLTASEDAAFQVDAFARQANATGAHFIADKEKYVEPWDEMLRQVAGVNLNEYQALPRQDIYKLARRISEKHGIDVADLTAEQIELDFDASSDLLFAFPGVSRLVNTYLWRLRKNRENMFRVEVEGEVLGLVPVPIEKEKEYFGPPPWILLNEIIDRVFKGKFQFSVPQGVQPNYQSQLLEVKTQVPVPISELSSGEKTLFYLALTIFNVQYRDDKAISAPGLLLIDEPDAFLHPSMVVELFNFLELIAERFDTKIIITTHSPTTVALAPSEEIIVVRDGVLVSIDKDEAIAELLDGVTQISISPHNRRQVYVESFYDAVCFTNIYQGLSKCLTDSKVSLSFCAAAEKIPENRVEEVFGAVFKKAKLDPDLVEQFIKAVNGIGSCSLVEGQVEELEKQGATTVRGLIDRDKLEKNRKTKGYMVVLGDGHYYAIENLIFNPVVVLHRLHFLDRAKYAIKTFCGAEVDVDDWLKDDQLLQKSADWFVTIVLGIEGGADGWIEFVSGQRIAVAEEYLNYRGHDLANLIIQRFAELNRLGNSDSKVMVELSNFMVVTGGKFIPRAFVDSFSKLRQ